ncbi:DMT family transporter [Pseudonocardia sp. CA-107938]|uniref:DMT family transporter n=1 Tax=Pseudonocardia sp. CA-107938 TaxID=3240021 RepID=UPI003D915619
MTLTAEPETTTRTRAGALYAAVGMTCVGSSVAVSQVLVDAPLFTAQALRYGFAAVLLLLIARLGGRPLPRPRGTDWCWLVAVAAVGLVVFNVAVVRGVEHAEPAAIGVAVATVPIALALAGPIAARRRPSPVLVVGALVVTAGAVLVVGVGRADAEGVFWAVVAMLCEAGFTLLAVPVLRRLGPWVVSLHTVWIAAVALAVLGIAVEGPAAVARLDTGDLLAALHLAVFVTALAFVLWYTAVGRMGAGRAGLFTGIAPVAAAVGGVLLGGPVPGPLVWAGTAVVGLGLAIGFASGRAA